MKTYIAIGNLAGISCTIKRNIMAKKKTKTEIIDLDAMITRFTDSPKGSLADRWDSEGLGFITREVPIEKKEKSTKKKIDPPNVNK